VYSISKLKYEKQIKKRPKLTCVIGGKCSDGVVLVSDSKVTYDDHPPANENKLTSPFYHIITGSAGSTDLYNKFQIDAVYATQPDVKIPESYRIEQPPISVTQPVVTSGVIHMYSGPHSFPTVQNNLGNIVKGLNKSKYAIDINGSLEVLVATQIGDTKTAVLSHMTMRGQSDVNNYRAIGSSGMYSYVFLKPH